MMRPTAATQHMAIALKFFDRGTGRMSRAVIPHEFPPPPWTGEGPAVCFIGRKLALVYSETKPRRHAAAPLRTRDGARRIAAEIAKSPALIPGVILGDK